MQKQLKDYTDDWGLLCYKAADGTMDGGDTCANEFTRLYCIHANRKQQKPSAEEVIEITHKLRAMFDAPSGKYVRHPDPTKWYSEIDRFSRDQLTPLLHFLALNVPTKAVKAHWANLVWQHAKRLFCFTWNSRKNFQYPTLEEHLAKSTPDVKWNYGWKLPDITGPSIWSVYCRGTLARVPKIVTWVFYLLMLPILLLGDLENLAGVVHKRFFSASTDHRNTAISVHYAAQFWPTPISRLAALVYGTATPRAAFAKFWAAKPEEPPIDLYMNKLYGGN